MRLKIIPILLSAVLTAHAANAQTVPAPFEIRAFHVDFRTEVMTPEALDALAENLSQKGFNAVVMEWEATFPFDKHATLCNQNAFTRQEVENFVSRCGALGVDVIPLQNCFGHCEYILRHDRYRALREDKKEVSQVCPLRIGEATAVFSEIFAEVAALHPSKYFHIGADETYLLGHCKDCAKAAETEKGKSKLFVDYVDAMCRIVSGMGKTPVIWADIILKYPQAVDRLPKDLIFVDWNYGWEPDRFGKLDNLFRAGVRMWGATALRSGPDNIYLTQWEKHFNNLATFIPFARQKGYTGMIQTSWSTSGLYGFHYDMGNEVVNMQPVRLVYPASGFNILLDAYARAVNDTEPLDPRKFVMDYGQTRYGLTAGDAEVLWAYFTLPQYPVVIHGKQPRDERGTPLEQALNDCLSLRDRFSRVVPQRGRADFDHYALMLDIRINYLKFKQVEAIYESSSYNRSQAPALAARLDALLQEESRLDKRFETLNTGYLKPNEVILLNDFRKEKMKMLYLWINGNQ